MNLHDPLPKTPDEFLRWNAYREGKREFVKGRVVEMMINTTRNHAMVSARLLNFIFNALGRDAVDYVVTSADFGLQTDDDIRYPDVLVERAGGAGEALATSEPIVVAEVLSKSTAHIDFGEKAIEYLKIESLRHYLVLAQDEPTVWLWSRDAEGKFGEPQIISDAEAEIDLSGLGISISVADIFRGIA
ncbi:MAG: Uma2 family endonuclease [Pseudomonadota bacterium]